MKGNLKQALENVDMMYEQLVEIANDIVDSYTTDMNTTIKEAYEHIESLSIDDLRNLMLRISLVSFSFSEIKEKSALKAECAEALKKEAYAKTFNGADGNNAVRENIALLETSDEIIVNAIHDLVSSLFKAKLDEAHRIIDVLKSILMSRMQEAKLSFGTSIGSPGDKTYLTE